MNNILITGLGNGVLGDNCGPCNYNYMQLIKNPSVLLWVDKVTVTKNIWKVITKENPTYQAKACRIVRLIMEYFYNKGMVEIIDSEVIFTKEIKNSLEYDIEKDVKLISDTYKGYATINENGIEHEYLSLVDGKSFCFPQLLSIYGDLYMAYRLNANCLFSEHELTFCNLKFGLTYENPNNDKNIISGVDKILESIIPDIHTLPEYLHEKRCSSCGKDVNNCEKLYLKELESTMKQYSEWREYDEFHLLRKNINDIISVSKRDKNIILPDDIYQPFNKKRERINSMIHKRLPKVKRFTNLVTALSTPITLGSIYNGNTSLAISSAISQSVSSLASAAINSVEEKYKWVNFTLK